MGNKLSSEEVKQIQQMSALEEELEKLLAEDGTLLVCGGACLASVGVTGAAIGQAAAAAVIAEATAAAGEVLAGAFASTSVKATIASYFMANPTLLAAGLALVVLGGVGIAVYYICRESVMERKKNISERN